MAPLPPNAQATRSKLKRPTRPQLSAPMTVIIKAILSIIIIVDILLKNGIFPFEISLLGEFIFIIEKL
jgi:hypothetical protein